MAKKQKYIYEIIKEFGIAYKGIRGASLEVNFISHSGKKPKVDIRRWYTDEKGERRLGKGIILKKDEFIKLVEILNNISPDIYDMEWTEE